MTMFSRLRGMGGRADTDEKKRKLVERILAAWMSPKGRDLRLGQLMANAGVRDTFAVEDNELAKLVEDYTDG